MTLFPFSTRIPGGQMVVGRARPSRTCPPVFPKPSPDEERPDPQPDLRILPPGRHGGDDVRPPGPSTTASWCIGCARASASPSTRWTASRPISQHPPARCRRRAGLEVPPEKRDPRGNFRFFENRQKYLLFVHTCSEKRVIAERVGAGAVQPAPAPAGAAGIRRRGRRRHGAGAGDALDARPLSPYAVLYRRQGVEPGGRPADARQGAGPAVRAPGDRRSS